jgi:hypothetical protein
MENEPDEMPSRLNDLIEMAYALDGAEREQVDVIVALAADLVQQFLFIVLLPSDSVGRRLVVKVSVIEELNDEFPDWAFSPEGRSMDLPLQLVDSAASAHFEFRAPVGLRVASVQLLNERQEVFEPPGPSICEGKTAHLTGLERLVAETGADIRARVELEPVADGFVRQTAWSTTFVAVLFGLAALASSHITNTVVAGRGGSLAATALAVPALFLTVQFRRPEHAWVARALFVPRLLNIATAGMLYAAALFIVTASQTSTTIEPAMWVLFVVQLLPTGLAVFLLRSLSAPSSTV